jgi:hypothetical protein
MTRGCERFGDKIMRRLNMSKSKTGRGAIRGRFALRRLRAGLSALLNSHAGTAADIDAHGVFQEEKVRG